jgi:hypothetical protein
MADLNNILDNAMKAGYIDEVHWATEGLAAAAGTIPGVGDGLAVAYKMFNVAKDSAETLVELKNNGFTVMAAAKLTQVAIGAVQVVTEPIPNVDRAADAVGLAIDHATYNMEIYRAICRLKQRILDISAGDGVQYHPQIFPFGAAFGYKYADGIEVLTGDGSLDQEGSSFAYAFGQPVKAVNITKPNGLDRSIPFHVIGEITLGVTDDGFESMTKFPELGAVRRGDVYYLPVDLTSLVQTAVTEGDTILDQLAAAGSAQSFTFTMLRSTCRRGKQRLAIQLSNGEVTGDFFVSSLLMNRVNAIELRGAPNKTGAMLHGDLWKGLTLFGTGPGIPASDQPDLTNRRDCLDMIIANPAIVELTRGPSLQARALGKGSTSLQVLLGGSIPSNGVPDVKAEFPFNVTALDTIWTGSYQGKIYNDYYSANVDVSISTSPGGGFLVTRSGQFPDGFPAFISLQGKVPSTSPAETDVYAVRVVVSNFKVLKGAREGYTLGARITLTPPNITVPGYTSTGEYVHTRGKGLSITGDIRLEWCNNTACQSAGSEMLFSLDISSAKP